VFICMASLCLVQEFVGCVKMGDTVEMDYGEGRRYLVYWPWCLWVFFGLLRCPSQLSIDFDDNFNQLPRCKVSSLHNQLTNLVLRN
jgi:hypothetical protein